VSEQVEEDDFWRFRRSCVQELWQSLLGGVGALPVAQLLALEAREGAAAAAGGGGWRRLEAALHLSECAAPALLPQGRRPTRQRLVSAGGTLRVASDLGSGGNGGGGNGGEAAARAARAAETSDAFADTAEQRALVPSVEATLSAACGVGDGAPPYLRAAALRCIAAFAPWLAPAERAHAMQGCVQAVLRSLGDPSVGRHAASAFSAICCYGGCAWRLGTDATLQQLLPPLLAALEQEPLASDGEAAETARSACMRLVVLLPPASIAATLDAIASPILASLPALGATLAAADDAESIADAGAAIAAALARLRSVARHLDSSPPLPQPGGGQVHPMVLLLGAAWPVLQPLAAPSARSAASFHALSDFFVLAMRAGGAAPLLPWLPQLLDAILAGLAAHNLAHALALAPRIAHEAAPPLAAGAAASDGAACALQTLAAAVERFGPEEAAKRKRPAPSLPSRAAPQHPIVLPRLSADAQDDCRRVDEALEWAKVEEEEQARHEAEERRAEEEEAATADAAAEAQRVAEEAAARAGELQRAADAAAAQRAMVTEYNKIRTQVNEMHEEYRQRNAGRNPRRRDLPDTYQALAARYEELKELLPGISDLAAAAKAAESADGGV